MTHDVDPIHKMHVADDLIRQRQEDAAHRRKVEKLETEERKKQERIQADIAERESMELQHELNKENRLLDHQFNIAEDKRELQRLGVETALKKRDDFVREQWANDAAFRQMQNLVMTKIVDKKIATKAAEQENALKMQEMQLAHQLELQKMRMEKELDLEFEKKRQDAGLTEKPRTDAEIDALIRQFENEEKEKNEVDKN